MSEQQQDLFALFGLPRQYSVVPEDLRKRYLQLQHTMHPDMESRQDAASRDAATLAGTRLNDAYDTIRDPVRRAVYLLQSAGVEFQPDRETTADAAYLFTQLELRESLASLNLSNNTDAQEQLDKLRDQAQRQLDTAGAEFSSAWQSSEWSAAKQAIARMLFAAKLKRDVRDREEELLDL